VEDYLKPRPGEKFLDLGCGPGDFVVYLPQNAFYCGCDPNPNYIQKAKEKYGHKGQFWVAGIDAERGLAIPEDVPACDTVLSMAVLHHLDERESSQLLDTAINLLEKTPGGRFVIFDNCLTDQQNKIAAWLIRHDRGRYAKTEQWYRERLGALFGSVEINVRTDLLRMPYTFIVAECRL
jgi:SAM-dependent methyltransferase